MATPRQILESMPVGFRFKPTDEELVNHYLRNKILGEDFLVQMIRVIDFCKHEPWDLPDLSVVKSEDPEWFFFYPPENKYPNSARSKRATEAGFWKVTGKERNVKMTSNNKVIGTKKTLVFHTGRVPNGVKTNWVIHEYHAITFPPNERTFVVCRLIKKTVNRAEGGSNALVYDEGEPSIHMAADYENQASEDRIPDVYSLPEVNLDSIFEEMPQAGNEFDLPSIQQSPLFTEQETSFQNSPLPSTIFGNETTEEEDNELFLNSILVDEDDSFIEQRQHAFINDFTPLESLGWVYYESSDTDAEIVSRLGIVPDTSTASNQHAGSREYRVMKMVHGAAHSRPQLASNLEESRKNRDGILFGDSSGGFTSDELSINCIQIASSPSPPRSYSSLTQKVASRRQLQRKASRTKDEDQKEASTVESRKYQRKAQGADSGKNLGTARDWSSVVDKNGSFIHPETTLLSHNPMPRSMYLLNVVVGLFLLVVAIWDLISSAKC